MTVNPAPAQRAPAEAAALSGGSGSPGDSPAPAPGETAEAAPGAVNAAYTLSYTGTGALEARIDIPLEEFRDVYMDGVLWIRDTDYTARSGSTVLSISQARMERLGAGGHRLSAVFAGETVSLEFTSDNIPIQDAGPDEGGSPIPSAAGIGAVLVIALAVIWRAAAKASGKHVKI
jgi:hypothetical protein